MQLLDDQSHLQSPVTQMHIADDMVSHIAADALDLSPMTAERKCPTCSGFATLAPP